MKFTTKRPRREISPSQLSLPLGANQNKRVKLAQKASKVSKAQPKGRHQVQANETADNEDIQPITIIDQISNSQSANQAVMSTERASIRTTQPGARSTPCKGKSAHQAQVASKPQGLEAPWNVIELLFQSPIRRMILVKLNPIAQVVKMRK